MTIASNIIPANRVSRLLMSMRELTALARAVSPVAGGSIAATVIGTAWWLLALHLAAPTEAGRFMAAFGIGTLIAEGSNLGAGYVVIRHLKVAGDMGSALIRSSLLAVTIGATILVTLIGTLMAIMGHNFPLHFGGPLLPMLYLTGLGACWFTITDNLLLATGRRGTIFVRSVLASLGRVAALVLLDRTVGLPWYSLLLSYALPQAVASISVCILLRKTVLQSIRVKPLLSLRELRAYVPYAWQSYVGNAVTALVPNLLPVIVVSRIGAVAGARFGVAWFIASLLMLVPAAISLTSFSTVARGERRLDGVVSRSNLLMLLVQIPIIVVALASSPFVFPHLGAAYASINFTQLAPLLFGVLCVGFTSQIYARARIVEGGLRVVMTGQALQAVIVLSLAFVLCPRFGITAAALAWLAGAGTACLLTHLVGIPYLAARTSRIAMEDAA